MDSKELLEKLNRQKSTLKEVTKNQKLNAREVLLLEAGYDLAVQFTRFLMMDSKNG